MPTILAHRLTTDLRPGDQITAIDGHRLRQPRIVAHPRVETAGGPAAVGLVNPNPASLVEWRLYPLNVQRVTYTRPVSTVLRQAALTALAYASVGVLVALVAYLFTVCYLLNATS